MASSCGDGADGYNAAIQYEYLRLRDLQKAIGQRTSFYGVITDYEIPKPTHGKDMICTMSVADMSWSSPPHLRVLVFGQRHQLPEVSSIGDIIRFHRAKMDIYEENFQAVCGKGSAFVLFHGNGTSCEPYQASTKNYTFEEHDCKILNMLRAWRSANREIDAGPPRNMYLLQIKNVQDGLHFDLCCKILHIRDEKFMYVWDGTDAASLTVRIDCIPLEVLRTFPSKGSVLQVFMDVFCDKSQVGLLQLGSWFKLRNIGCRLAGGRFEGFFTKESKIGKLPCDSQQVKDAESYYEYRVSTAEAGVPERCPKPLMSPTVTDYEHVPFSSLREILAHEQVTYRFRCMVKVTSTWPSDVSEFCGLWDGRCVYRVRLRLEDPTAEIHAYLFGEDGERFFNGYPAARRNPEDSCLAPLERAVHRLLGSDVGEPPWIKCCIQSYYLDKDEPWSSRRFRIFGTRLP